LKLRLSATQQQQQHGEMQLFDARTKMNLNKLFMRCICEPVKQIYGFRLEKKKTIHKTITITKYIPIDIHGKL
jgi:excinuclease UvrABC helicase subunit UvrB